MAENRVYEAIEKLNSECMALVNSSEYRNGKRMMSLMRSLKKLDIKAISAFVKAMKRDRKAMKMGLITPKEIKFNRGKEFDAPVNAVVYTCITGGYDTATDPYVTPVGVDWLLYTDSSDDSNKSKIWQWFNVNEMLPDLKGRYINRYCKLHPFELMKGYEFAVYIDGNIGVMSDITPLLSIARDAKCGIAMHRHSDRDCMYREAEACILYGRGKKDKILEQVKRYHKEGFPENFGLSEATIIVIDLKNPVAEKLMNAWWDELCAAGSERDQLAFPYVVWKNGYTIDDIGWLGNCVKLNPKFRMTVVGHNK